MISLKETVDEAVRGLDYVRRIYVAQRTGAAVNMQEGRDLQLQEVRQVQKISKFRRNCPSAWSACVL